MYRLQCTGYDSEQSFGMVSSYAQLNAQTPNQYMQICETSIGMLYAKATIAIYFYTRYYTNSFLLRQRRCLKNAVRVFLLG